jgi:hypothetical protein
MTLVASYKQQATSYKQQAAGSKPATNCRASLCRKIQAASVKQQAASFKQGWFESFWGVRQIVARYYVTKTQDASGKHQAPSNKHQAASREQLAL